MAAVLVNLGEEWAVDRLTGASALNGQYGHWGTGAGTAAKGDTGLFTPGSEARVAGTVSKTGSGSTAKYQNVFTLTADATKTITNAGTFGAVSGGDMYTHWDHGGITIDAGDQIQYTVTLDPA